MPPSSFAASIDHLRSYRADVDALRGIAVLLVVGFHWGVRHFDGGFVGVDIFFVISGFLITRIIYTEALKGEFSFVRFYERRVRRIVPALYGMVAAVAVFALFFLLPDEYTDFSESALSVVTFCSNFLFWRESGYFAQASHGKPLLHTWSLAVEEQFYLIFPLVIFALTRLGRRRDLVWMAALAFGSFAFSVWHVRHDPDGAFYLAPGRAWEFLLGSLLAVPGLPLPSSGFQRLLAMLVGFALIFVPVILFREQTLFPGENALPPCLGAALIIWANAGSEGRLPRNVLERVLAFFGLISYSLYLWHWPVLIFYRRWLGTSPEYTRLRTFDRAAMFAASLALSYASYRLIEQPVRRRLVGQTRQSLFAGAAIASTALLAFGVAGVAWQGFPARVNVKVASIANYSKYPVEELYEVGSCFLRRQQKFADLKPACLELKPDVTNILIWGDSVAAHYVHGLKAAAQRLGVNIARATSSACPPLLGVELQNLPNCPLFNEDARAFIREKRPDAVVLAGVWNVVGRQQLGYDRVIKSLRRTIEGVVADGARVFVLGPPVEYVERLPYLLSQYAMTDVRRFEPGHFMEPTALEYDRRMGADLRNIAGVRYISVIDTVCIQRSKCPVLLDGSVPMQWDQHHLTAEGSVLVADRLLPIIVGDLKRGF